MQRYMQYGMHMSNAGHTAKPLPDREYRTASDAIAHIREQAALLVLRVNEGRAWTGTEFADKTAEVYAAMLAKLTANLTGTGRADLAAIIMAAA